MNTRPVSTPYQPLEDAYVESLGVKEQITAWHEMAEGAASELRKSGGAVNAHPMSLRRS